MPRDGLLLVGYLNEDAAVDYMKKRCSNSFTHDESSLRTAWREAYKKVQSPVAWLHPSVLRDIPPNLKHHTDLIEQDAEFAEVLDGMDYKFQVIEIDPLLAFQVDIDFARSDQACAGINQNPSIAEMLPRCLPTTKDTISFTTHLPASGKKGIVLETENRNVVAKDAEYWGIDAQDGLHTAGIKIGARPSLIQVVKFGSKYFLKNGYHRAFGLRKRGATEMPCLLLDGLLWGHVGAHPDEHLPESLFWAANPATCGHFVHGLAMQTKLRQWIPQYEINVTPGGRWKD